VYPPSAASSTINRISVMSIPRGLRGGDFSI
jgi:hypothetical protein